MYVPFLQKFPYSFRLWISLDSFVAIGTGLKLLRYADREKNATISGFTPTSCRSAWDISEHFSGCDDYSYNRFVDVMEKRFDMMRDDTHLVAG
jgi:hypothetical protein